MKRYEFHSSLPPEEVFARLDAHAKRWDPSSLGDGTFRFKRKKDGFWLEYMGTIPATGAAPFCGMVYPAEGGSVISGGFSVWRAKWKPMAVIWGIMYLPVSMLGVPLWVYLLMFALASLWGTGFLSVGQKVFFREYQCAVLSFIEKNLLK